jgi:hypothetical protein
MQYTTQITESNRTEPNRTERANRTNRTERTQHRQASNRTELELLTPTNRTEPEPVHMGSNPISKIVQLPVNDFKPIHKTLSND